MLDQSNPQSYALEDRYDAKTGRVFLTGTQALVRILMDQARRDREGGLNTAGFVSGYRGSPLGGVDQELWRAKKRLAEEDITFLPAVNEDLGATAVLGSQQAILDPDARVEGVFAMWYGKGPGVDRSGDALRHGNAYGSSPKGGVLVVAGDDHGCVSSSMPHQSDVAFMTWFMPVLNPASVAEYLSFGEYGFALSRFSGTWVGFKAISETVESGASVELPADREFTIPQFDPPPGGLHIRPADLPSPEIETRLTHKLRAVEAFVEANPIDRRIYDIKDASYGIVTTGKGHLDLMEALRLLGLDEDACRRLGIDIYKVGMVWPLARRDALRFMRHKAEVLVVEEKRGIIESQFKEHFYDWPGDKPQAMVGKHDETGANLIPFSGELSPRLLAPIIADRLHRHFPAENFPARAAALAQVPDLTMNVAGATRTPYFCSGCPHNTSTKLPDGSMAASGIGCHVMASWMDRNTVGYAQMGGEGVPWIARQAYNGGKHIFQNLGEGTWYHSGSLAIRQSVAAQANITYKILYNDAVAMTGGQPVDGPVSAAAIAQTCRAEGVGRIAVVSDTPEKFDRAEFPDATTFDHRDRLDIVQRELRDIPGVTVLIYEQTCATEKRRRRKRGLMEDPAKAVVINERVCEGCGDCSVASNCLSVEPVETPFGRKRRINQNSCNKDFSCLGGFCPSFVTIEGASRKKPRSADLDMDALMSGIELPDLPELRQPYDLLVGGVGGTGVVTVGALITMAAHLEGKGSSVLDFTGFAQKFGTVLGYVRLASHPDEINQLRIENGAADAMIGCDIVVASAPKASALYRPGTRAVLNLAEMPTGDLVLNRDADLRVDARLGAISKAVGAGNVMALDANRVSQKLLGDSVFANVLLLGYAWQAGLVPVGLDALYQAIRLNGTAIEANRRAFDLGRVLAAAPDRLPLTEPPAATETSASLLDRFSAELTEYQNAAYAAQFREVIGNFATALPELPPAKREALLATAARALFRLMAYKDEYEVARLLSSQAFRERLAGDFEGGRMVYNLAPPFLPARRDTRGRPVKRRFGPWLTPFLRVLARGKALRGTAFDPFGLLAERREERELIDWYKGVLKALPARISAAEVNTALKILAAPTEMRGYGPVKQAAIARNRAAAEEALDGLAANLAAA
ncbi:indolepyruvate ferredoxin oxidoreductase family protein [Paracoccus aurantiacus]|uniref:Indolepyruvate ferredoxin oxidoreductase family protein n=1 Tax=Paracoccus aurantiacus TaxID=2599412 RepID=A0A5C6RW15_9RHOB|nr:indolepyruvate ferredoxin oxidoreductase family protein [Paracoccus aurantiacus]TXB66413.1 indolepyruvate ferredoxin oxidoreductase family protein [Paracoccus aurantiacus]